MKRKMSTEEAKWRRSYIRELAKKEKEAALLALLSEEKQETAKCNGRTLTMLDRSHAHRQSVCNHHKGGKFINRMTFPNGGQRIETTFPVTGCGMQYSVIKHQMTHGDIWVRCLRCGKWWKPPLRSQYTFDRDFWKAMFEYEEAVAFPTNNTMSGSVQARFTQTLPNGEKRDATEIVRERLKDSAGY